VGATSSIKSGRVLLFICYLGFVSLGLPDTLIGVAWPSIRDSFAVQQGHISWIFFGSGCSYFLSSFFAGRLLKILNVGVLLALSSALVAFSAANYSFATLWWWFAAGSLLHGLGSGAIDSGLNHYVATHFSARHMNWLHASYSLGAMLGPMVMTTCLSWNGSWRLGYFIVAVTLLALSLLFLSTKKRWDDPAQNDLSAELPISTAEPPHMPLPESSAPPIPAATVLRNRVVRLHILLFFIYTGLEVALGQWSFTILTESRNIDRDVAGLWVTIYWAGILAGRILFGFIVDRTGIDLLIRLSTLAALVGAALFAWNPSPQIAPVSLGIAGLGLAVIFPSLMTRTPQRLGREMAAHAIGFQVGAAMLGAAILPSLCGLVAQYAGLNFVAPMLLALAIALFLLHEFLLRATAARTITDEARSFSH
jgi:fucose permease